MAYDRLSAEIDDEDWCGFRLADKPPSEQGRAEFQVPKGFALDDIREAARATGWVVEREGCLWIDQRTDCAVLANFVAEMLFYFDAPKTPSKRLTRIMQAVDGWLAGAGDDEVHLSPWTCAWLDLLVREDAKEDIMTAEDIWHADVLNVDISKHRERRLREVLQRLHGQAETTEPDLADDAETGRMAPSQRTRRGADKRRRDVG